MNMTRTETGIYYLYGGAACFFGCACFVMENGL